MAKIGIFFGSDTGNTQRVAKTIAKALGGDADKPMNVNKAKVEDMLRYDALILGTPTLGEGELPGLGSCAGAESWEEFLPSLEGQDLSGKTVAIYGLGDQEGYGHEFVNGMRILYDQIVACGAKVVGAWPTSGYKFEKSTAIVDGKFVGLVLDEENQSDLHEERINDWLLAITPALLKE